MIVHRIEFERFRNLENTAVDFDDGVNVLRGQNAQGKSNILEGIYLFARGKSFRGARVREMICHDAESAVLRMGFAGDRDTRDTDLEIQLYSDNSRKYFRRGAPLRGVREMIGNFRAVLFCPSHLSLAGGAPANRRSYLDIALSQVEPSYIDELARYQKLLLHRNALLKDAAGGKTVSAAEWESFAMVIAMSGARIAADRIRYTALAAEAVSEFFCDMTAGAETPSLTYESSYLRGRAAELLLDEAKKPVGAAVSSDVASELVPLYTDHLERELRLGATHYGIHKDDIAVTLNGRDARIYASQGQQRSIALAMKLAEGELSRKISGEYPVFLLDDVLSELDSARRSYVLSSVGGRQIIITSCDADLFSEHPGARVIGVEKGSIIG